MNQRHNIVRKAEIQVLQIDTCRRIARIIPSGINLIPFAIHLHGIPDMTIARHARVLDVRLVEQKRITAVIRFTCSQLTRRQGTVDAAVHKGLVKRLHLVHVVIVGAVVDNPIVEPERFLVVRHVTRLLTLRNHIFGDLLDGRICGIGHRDIDKHARSLSRRCSSIHHVEAKQVAARSVERERSLIRGIVTQGARGINDPVPAILRLQLNRVEIVTIRSAAAITLHEKRRRRTANGIIPRDSNTQAIARGRCRVFKRLHRGKHLFVRKSL